MISNTLVSFKRLGMLVLVGWLTVVGSLAWGQIEDPVTWNVALYPSEETGLHDLVVHASVDACWHIYSQDNDPNEGPVPTMFELDLPSGVQALGNVEECTPIEEYDPNFMMDLKYFEEEVFWHQRLDLSGANLADTLKGYVVFMVCDASMCLPPEEIPIAVALSDVRPDADRPVYCPPSKHLCNHGAGEGGDADHGENEGEGDELSLIHI